MPEQILDSVKSKYGAVAESTLSSDHAGVKAVAEAFGYTAEELTSIPAEANMGLSCGNPTATAHLRPGEVVVDLGSGGGLDVFLASKMVGPAGRAIGIDMTPAMIDRARANAAWRAATPTSSSICPPSTEFLCPMPPSIASSPTASSISRPTSPPSSAKSPASSSPAAVSRSAISPSNTSCPRLSPTAWRPMSAASPAPFALRTTARGLLAAGFEHVEIVDSGRDLNAYAKVENQSGCCSPSMDSDHALAATPALAATSPLAVIEPSCCTPTLAAPASLHEELASLLSQYDVNAAAASVKVYALKPQSLAAQSCCGPACCS